MFKNKIFFFSKRCDYNKNKIFVSKDLLFLLTIPFIVITRPFNFIIKNDSNENNFDINHSKMSRTKKDLYQFLRHLKKRRFKSLISSTLSKLTYQHIII